MLFDRDETIVVDVPFNGDPERVEPAPDARALLDRLRAAGLPLAVVSNQSGIGRGLHHARGGRRGQSAASTNCSAPSPGFFVCPHAPEDGCDCRKPKAEADPRRSAALGVDPACCVVVGDRDSDVEAARNAGAIALRVEGPPGLARRSSGSLLGRGGVEPVVDVGAVGRQCGVRVGRAVHGTGQGCHAASTRTT